MFTRNFIYFKIRRASRSKKTIYQSLIYGKRKQNFLEKVISARKNQLE